MDSDTRTAAKEKLRARASAVGVPPRTRNFSAGLGPRSCGAEDSEAMRSGGPRPAPALPLGAFSGLRAFRLHEVLLLTASKPPRQPLLAVAPKALACEQPAKSESHR